MGRPASIQRLRITKQKKRWGGVSSQPTSYVRGPIQSSRAEFWWWPHGKSRPGFSNCRRRDAKRPRRRRVDGSSRCWGISASCGGRLDVSTARGVRNAKPHAVRSHGVAASQNSSQLPHVKLMRGSVCPQLWVTSGANLYATAASYLWMVST